MIRKLIDWYYKRIGRPINLYFIRYKLRVDNDKRITWCKGYNKIDAILDFWKTYNRKEFSITSIQKVK